MKKPSIVTVPEHTLYEVTQQVASFDENLKNQINLMQLILQENDGVGLAANQIGFKNQVCIVEFKGENEKENIPFQTFVNPKIIQFSETTNLLEEGCLSLPQIELPVERSSKIKVRAQNAEGKSIKITAKGLLARVLQHEIDHLNGIVFTDRINQWMHKNHPELKKMTLRGLKPTVSLSSLKEAYIPVLKNRVLRSEIKIIFFGSGDFALPLLKGLILLGFNIDIMTEKAKPAGRQKNIKPTPVGELAKKFKKDYLEIDRFDQNITNQIKKCNPDLIICADFGKKVPHEILNSAKIKAINIHPSMLPKYRGPSPIQAAILNGDEETGVTIIKMSQEIDQGPILAQVKTEILPTDNALILENRLATLSLKLIYELLPLFINNQINEKSQEEKDATYTKKFQKSDGEIIWQKKPQEIERQIRAFYPWPGTFTYLDNKRLIIHQAHLEDKKLVLDKVQLEGKKPVLWQEFLRGYHGVEPEWIKELRS